VGFCALLGLLAGGDAWLSRWKNRRTLGPFVLQTVLGQGGMGVVYRARHLVSGQTVALKVLHPRWSAREDLRLRFLREAQALTRLAHPNIVRVLETGAVGDRGYISMELLAGVPLSASLRAQGPLAPTLVVELLAACCDALAHVHAAGLVHGDIKSANLFLLDPADLAPAAAHGWRPRIKLMDFGLAQCIDDGGRAEGCAGTPAYMAPEQLRRQPLDARSDLYSLGVVGYEALAGRLPAEGEVPLGRPDVPAALDRLLAQMLAREPADRPASAAALGIRLRELRAGGALSEPLPAALPALPALVREGADAPERDTDTIVLSPTSWQGLLRQAQNGLAQGQVTQGQVLLMDCLAALEQTLAALSEEEREAYCRSHREVGAVLALQRRLSPGRPLQQEVR
jgi:serine/threonine protein kinase